MPPSSSGTPSEVTTLLLQMGEGKADAMDRLMPLVYDQLRALAAAQMRHEDPAATLQPTALVHEAWLRLVDQRHVSWTGRAHFFGLAGQLMRRIIVDHARRRRAAKRGGTHPITLDDNMGLQENDQVDVLAVDEALARLATLSSRQARIVELRFFGGLTAEETAVVLDVSPVTVKRDWSVAKAWLRRELGS
jgi:RNA polymerase sigma factor (TIGR02999 family)